MSLTFAFHFDLVPKYFSQIAFKTFLKYSSQSFAFNLEFFFQIIAVPHSDFISMVVCFKVNFNGSSRFSDLDTTVNSQPSSVFL